MIIAWHILTDLREDKDVTGFLTSKESFEEIKRTGAILPPRMRGIKFKGRVYKKRRWRKRMKSYYPWNMFIENSQMMRIDAIAGDNSYVFLGLSIFKRPDAFLPEMFDRRKILGRFVHGFGFDAENLVENGAVVRKEDYVRIYEDIIRRFASEVIVKKIAETIDVSKEKEYFDHLAWKSKEIQNISECLYYIGRLGKMKELRKALLDFKAMNDMQGSKALEFVRNAYQKCIDSISETTIHPKGCMFDSDFYSLEILWPGPLNIKNAKYVIEGGVTKRL